MTRAELKASKARALASVEEAKKVDVQKERGEVERLMDELERERALSARLRVALIASEANVQELTGRTHRREYD